MTLARVTIAPRRSVALFALLAILMVIASYVVIVALAAACVYLPYLALTSTTNLQVLILFLGGIAAAGAMLWSLVPRREKFEEIGRASCREREQVYVGRVDLTTRAGARLCCG